jgi:hypothetical protein
MVQYIVILASIGAFTCALLFLPAIAVIMIGVNGDSKLQEHSVAVWDDGCAPNDPFTLPPVAHALSPRKRSRRHVRTYLQLQKTRRHIHTGLRAPLALSHRLPSSR